MKEDALVQFKLMLPAGLKKSLEERAQANRRALSQEIVTVLEESLPTTRDRLKRTYALIDLANILTEFEGEEGKALRKLVTRKVDDEIRDLGDLRERILKEGETDD